MIFGVGWKGSGYIEDAARFRGAVLLPPRLTWSKTITKNVKHDFDVKHLKISMRLIFLTFLFFTTILAHPISVKNSKIFHVFFGHFFRIQRLTLEFSHSTTSQWGEILQPPEKPDQTEENLKIRGEKTTECSEKVSEDKNITIILSEDQKQVIFLSIHYPGYYD